MEQHRKVYETTFIVNATLDDAQIDQVIDRFKEFIGKQSGEVTSLEKWGRKRLARSWARGVDISLAPRWQWGSSPA